MDGREGFRRWVLECVGSKVILELARVRFRLEGRIVDDGLGLDDLAVYFENLGRFGFSASEI